VAVEKTQSIQAVRSKQQAGSNKPHVSSSSQQAVGITQHTLMSKAVRSRQLQQPKRQCASRMTCNKNNRGLQQSEGEGPRFKQYWF